LHFRKDSYCAGVLRPRLALCLAVSILCGIGLSKTPPAAASNKYLEIPSVSEAEGSLASHYANLTNEQTLVELNQRRVPYRRTTAPQEGVRLPIRLTGPLRGVHIHSVLPEQERATTPFEILDGRLALALDDFARILARHDIVEVIHFSIYRPSKTLVTKGETGLFRRPGGLAIDLGAVKKRSGHWLAVGPHWPSQIGAKTCGQGGRSLAARKGRELMSIVCEASDQRIFHYMLTPHFDQAHADHLHLEVKPGVKWFLVN
jgi:hypothetical protein